MLEFVLTIILIYFLYYIWITFNYDKTGNFKKGKKNKRKEKKMPSEVEYFVFKYNVDLDKINYRYFLQLMGLVVAFDLTIVITLLSFISIIWLKIVLGFILVLTISLLSFYILGKYFKKKGLTKNENDKRNRK